MSDDIDTSARASRRRRRKKQVWIALAIVAVGGGATATAFGLGLGADSAEGTTKPPASHTAKVTRQNLKDSQSADGQLGFGATSSAISRTAGTLTQVPNTGDLVDRGQSLYAVDAKPVTLMHGDQPAYRAMQNGTAGADVRQLEENLRELGYSGFTVDDDYTYQTATAVEKWQADRGLDQTGVVDLGQVVFTSGQVRVESLNNKTGEVTSPGQVVLTYTGTSKAITVELDIADQRLAKKDAVVDVRLPDSTTVPGTITKVDTRIRPASSQGEDPTTTVEVTVALTDEQAQKAAESYVMASVDVDFTVGTRENVLTVPVSALLALPQGGYGIEVIKGTESTYVPVDTGLFADGQVEISGEGISEGMSVGVPA
ncbi:MAG: HlyD family efflux transporter periplasmic adaptor subunit [Corynebacteriales bacterium]|nr:HlyD family efflux transporter periplasmic adaptor subunit [Mycobacteriales bacterium]